MRGFPLILMVSVGLAAGGAASVFAQTYRMISVRGSFVSAADIRVWEVTASGSLTQVQQIDFTGTGERFHVDPFGEFMIYRRGGQIESVIEVYEIDMSGTLSLASSFERQGLVYRTLEHALSPDGRIYVTLVQNRIANPDEWYIEALRVNDDLTLEALPGRILIHPNGIPEMWPPETRGLAIVTTGDEYFLLTATIGLGRPHINVQQIQASGEITPRLQSFDFPEGTSAITGGWAVRSDQRLAVTGPMSDDFRDDGLTSYAIGSDGLLTPVDTYDMDEFGIIQPSNIIYHPSGLSILSGGGLLQRYPITRDGRLIKPAIFGPGGNISAAAPAVSPDGKIAVATYDSTAEGGVWGVFALEPSGGLELLQNHILPFGYRDIAFIPPRTEEMLGDANGDGRRDAADVVTYANHFDDTLNIQGPVPLARADADQDGDIDEKDADWLLEFLLGLKP